MTAAREFVTDGGLETDLIFNRGVDLPDFAAFPLVADSGGRRLLAEYYTAYAAIAAGAGAGLLLETPTWRANQDWATRLGYDAESLAGINRQAVTFLRGLTETWSDRVGETRVSGQIGPRGDGYRPGAAVDPDEAAAYHRPQIAAFHEAGADLATALTLTDVGEALGVVAAARDVGLPVAVSFTVETDGRLPGGMTVADAVAEVDAAGGPAYFLLNCAHPEHIERGLGEDGAWRERIQGLRVNASTMSHEELDEAAELDDGDPVALASAHERLEAALPAVRIVGGCCGTDARHVAAMWGQPAPLA
jgi:S-methylmethionine-dependent homocysteine/selenocysteine methylase